MTEMRAVSQAGGKALRDLFPTCSSHSRAQQAGDRELWGPSQLAEMSTDPQCHCVATHWNWTTSPM